MESPKILLTAKNVCRAQLKVKKRDLEPEYSVHELYVYYASVARKNDKAKCQNFQESSVNEKQFKNMKGPYDPAIPLVDIYSKQLKAGT